MIKNHNFKTKLPYFRDRDILSNKNNEMSDKRYTRRKTTNYGNINGKLTPSAGLNRNNSLKYSNLSPVRSYYNRRFGRTSDDESTRKPKENYDKEKTPVPSGLSSTISRLESKYSDILSRYGRKKEVKGDREKTLEPERQFLPITKSKTSIFNSTASSLSSQKEKTPYRNKYLDYHEYKPRTELPDRKKYLSRLENEATSSRYKDLTYDAPLYQRNKYEGVPTKNDNTFYNGNNENDNLYKSKYDPDSLYSELRRPNQGYRRSVNSSDRRLTSNYKLCPIDYGESIPSTSFGSSNLKRSQTQKFFDFENLSIQDASKTLSAKEARRKEVQELIQKYAPKSDDKSSEEEDAIETKEVEPKIVERRPLLQHQNSIKTLQSMSSPVNQLDILSEFSTYKSRIPNVYSSFVRFFFILEFNLKSCFTFLILLNTNNPI